METAVRMGTTHGGEGERGGESRIRHESRESETEDIYRRGI